MMEATALERVLTNLAHLVPVVHRTVGKGIFREAWQNLGENVSRHHLEVMRKLHESGPLCMAEIADDLLISRPQMTRLIDELVDLGMVVRIPDEADRRRINASLTDRGVRTLDRFQSLLVQCWTARLSTVGDEDLEELSVALEKLREALSRTE